ncbi:MAG: hypothetical protein R3290_04790 [Acidimicrobiia bacterium]|nr:hypothetical protein [Acidimicrobiia bacterium]
MFDHPTSFAPDPPAVPVSERHRVRPGRRVRLVGRGVASWAYGLAITLMLVGLWGRAASVDRPVVEEAAATAVQAAAVGDRVVGWIVDATAGELDALPADVEPVVRAVLATPSARAALSDVTGVLVDAALSDPDERVVLDLRATIEPHLPAILATVELAGTGVSADEVTDALGGIEPIVLQSGTGAPFGRALDGAERALRLAALVGASAAAALFALVLLLADDRRAAARSLAGRTFLGAAGFAAMLRLGAWALDPGAGGTDAAPTMRAAIAVLVRSNLHLPLVVATVAGGVWLGLRRRRRTLHRPPSRRPEVTGEIAAVPSGG